MPANLISSNLESWNTFSLLALTITSESFSIGLEKKIFSITERAIQFITKNYKNKNPFFLQISHYAIHSNLIMRKEENGLEVF